jgi:predicted permease
MISSLLKVVVAPAIGLALFRLAGITPEDYMPGLIILAAPTAVLVHILSTQLGGDPDYAPPAKAFCTILSGFTYAFWLAVGR